MKKHPIQSTGSMKPRIFIALFAILISVRSASQSSGDVRVTLENDESLRSLAREYLGNPNDWEVILYYNGLKSSENLKTGQILWIPAQKFKILDGKIRECQALIVSANAEGAGILVPLKMEQAIEFLNRAVERKKKGDLNSAGTAADLALSETRNALAETREKRLQSVSAVLAEKRGTVQFRPNDEMQWKDAVSRQELIANDRLRTLSRSFGNVVFIDGSRMQVDENALIVIEEVNRDVLKNSSCVDILVLEGDVTALINSLQNNNSFKVASPGVDTRIRSRNFLASRDREKTTRFSNFEGEMDVAAGGKEVTLSGNEGTKVAYGKAPEPPKTLPASPSPVSPGDGQPLFDNRIGFRWEPVEDAGGYLIQISRNKSFTEIEKSIRVPAARTVAWEAPQNGGYYWRIRAIDREQLQGPFSKPVGFTVQVDRIPPYLALTSPSKDTVVFGPSVRIRGRSEKGVMVTVNQDTVPVSESGEFEAAVNLREGRQILTITASDKAGNSSRAAREVTSNLGEELFQLSGPAEMFSNSRRVLINGWVKPSVRLEADGRPVETRNDFFTYSSILEEGPHVINLKAASPKGLTQEKAVKITIDTTAPEMRIGGIPEYTDQAFIVLEGGLSEPAEIAINGLPKQDVQDRFSSRIELKEAANPISIRVMDRAGNISEKSLMIVKDTEPPKVLSYHLSANRVQGGEIVRVDLKANDKGIGLARTSTCILEIAPGKSQLSGLLKLNQESDSYEGSLIVPPGINGTLTLNKLYVSDYLGNTTVIP